MSAREGLLEAMARAIHEMRFRRVGREPLPMEADDYAYCIPLARAARAAIEAHDGGCVVVPKAANAAAIMSVVGPGAMFDTPADFGRAVDAVNAASPYAQEDRG